ncbi:MAG: NADH-quinone oxidoreductase subunit NuoF [Armatimonadota bacterium]
MEPVLTRNIKPDRQAPSLREYEAAGGYSALRQALSRHTPDEVVKIVSDADLRGRGGAGYPAGRKWAGVPPVGDSGYPRIIITNCDEMEPGTFKDRLLVEGDPHQLIEGMLIAAYACQCDLGYMFVRAEYTGPARALARAVAEAREAGYIGRNILGSGWDFELHMHLSAGRYMCGEGMGLAEAMEGKKAYPRTKPPYEVAVGVWGRPTVVNNVETLCCVPHIISRGAKWFRSLGRAEDAGMKIYGVSGRVKRPGSFELPMGTTMRELVEEHAGGMLDGYRFRAALPGGASTMFLDESELDVPLEFEALKRINCYFGTGTAIVLDDHTCVVGMVRNLEQFYARESCGWCTPCRDGLPWIEEVLGDIEEGRGRPDDLDWLLEQADAIGPNTFCALALGAVQPVQSSVRKLRAEYEEHLRRRGCPFGGA